LKLTESPAGEEHKMQKQPVVNAFTLEEAEPVLQAISKLQHVVVAKPSPYLLVGWPHICWLTRVEFGVINSVSWKFKGNARWYLLSDMPRTCLVAEIGEDRFPVAGAEQRIPLAESLRELATSDLPRFAEFLEEALQLKHKSSLGYELSNQELELPLVEDHVGSGRPVAIVADPVRYALNEGLPTSQWDRTIHFWITEEEYDQLYAILEKHRQFLESSDFGEYPLLWRIVTESYGNVAIQANEVEELSSECQRLSKKLGLPLVSGALLKIESICRSAQNYKLGICITGG
jgi:hypothetical protein